MKKLLLILVSVLGVGLFTACEKDDINLSEEAAQIESIALSSAKTTISVDALPNVITDYVSTNYFETFIEEAYKSGNDGYELELGTGENVYFDEDGEALGRVGGCKGHGFRGHGRKGDRPFGGFSGDRGDRLSPDELPETITTYITENYPDATIRGGKLNEEDGSYWVGLSGHILLSFDADGNFIEEVTHERGNVANSGETVAIEDLPASITDYVTANYPDAEIRRAKLKDDQYYVGVTGHVLLIFDASGSFVEERTFMNGECDGRGEVIAIEELPTTITDYLAANYADAEVRKAKLKNDQYYVGLLINEEKVIVVFDADGNFVEERIKG